MVHAAGLALDLGMSSEIEALLAPIRARLGKDCLSEYSFANLYLFRAAHDYRYCPGAFPCVAGVTYDGSRHLLPLFELESAPEEILAGLLAGRDHFFPVAAPTLARLDRARFSWTAVRDDSDYLYRSEAFRAYRGRRLRKKRNLMGQLLARHRPSAAPLTAETLPDARRILEGWMRDKEKAPGDADEQACVDALAALGTLALEGVVYYADGDAAGFLIAQELSPGVHTISFAKGLDRYRGVYPFMFHDFCEAARPRGGRVEWVNFEQDLGLPNFRKTKLSYDPHALLEKHRVCLR